MDKKIKFSEQPTKVKIVYSAVIAILCLTAIVVGIVAAASRKDNGQIENPSENEGEGNVTDGENNGEGNGEGDAEGQAPTSYVAPLVGTVAKYHDIETPVFSNTLDEYRIHTGIDISCEDGSEVYAAADGVVSAVRQDVFLGKTVEITHGGGVVSVYCNLADSVKVSVGDEVKSGDKIGVVGDTSLTELADEPHLHFEIKVNGVSVNPLDYISEDSKEASLGISDI